MPAYCRNEKFLIVRDIKNFILGLEKLLLTFPKNDIFTRNMVYCDSLEILELVFMANYEKDKDKKSNYQVKAMSKINKVDFYLERAYKLKYLSEKQLMNKSNELLTINKMIYGWYNNEQ